jgi:hypothetical protein
MSRSTSLWERRLGIFVFLSLVSPCFPESGLLPSEASHALPHQTWDTLALIELPSGPFALTDQTTSQFFTALAEGPHPHLFGVASFARHPTQEERLELAALGLEVISPLQGVAFRVRVDREFRLNLQGSDPPVTALGMLRPQDRVSPPVWSGNSGTFETEDSLGVRVNYVVDPEGTWNLLVRFYAGSSPADQESIIEAWAQEATDLGGEYWRIVASPNDLASLAEHDAIWWIDGVPGPATAHMDVVRRYVNLDHVQGFGSGRAFGPAGNGVQVGLFDQGADDVHDDFSRHWMGYASASRIKLNEAGPHSHGTGVAGIIAGDGYRSDKSDSNGTPNWDPAATPVPFPDRWRGMAPHAELIDTHWLRFCPGPYPPGTTACPWATYDYSDLIVGVARYISAYGLDVSNHAYSLSADGRYSLETAIHDHVIRGNWSYLTPPTYPLPGVTVDILPRLHVYSAGNSGYAHANMPGHQVGYFGLTNQTKNGITVGAHWIEGDRVLRLSSRGPTYDGRIKPDVLAPGWMITSTMYCDADDNRPLTTEPGSPTPCSPDSDTGVILPRRNFYWPQTGTSAAAAVVTGMSAVVLDAYSQEYSVGLDQAPPLPSTLRGITIHSAKDQVTPGLPDDSAFLSPEDNTPVRAFEGPDFASGWGVVDAEAAVELVRGRRIIEGSIETTCDEKTYSFYRTAGADVKVTLTWDDPPGDPAESDTLPKLVNDLDLVLIDPDGGEHFPWRLNHSQVLDKETGVELADADQTCGRAVRVARQLRPTLNPAAENDPIDPDSLKAADHGKDHLNNVEQVVASPSQGVWVAKVTGYSVPFGPQSFSLVGITPPTVLMMDPRARCRGFPEFCEAGLYLDLCVRFPQLCEDPLPVDLLPDGISGRFQTESDSWILPLRLLCARLGGRCPHPDSSAPLELIVGPPSVPVGLSLYDQHGGRFWDSSAARAEEGVVLPMDPGVDFLLVVTPLGPLDGPMEVMLPLRFGLRQ